MTVTRALAPIALGLVVACGSTREPFEPGRSHVTDDAPAPSVKPATPAPIASAAGPTTTTDLDDPELRAVLERVARARGLPIRRPVRFATVSRDDLLQKTRKKLAEEIPEGVVELQGESLRAFGLIPLDYDVEEGLLKLLQGRVAGFYDPDDGTMYLLDDLNDQQRDETLSHELVHALQDQSFDLGALIEFQPGKSDALTAVQLLVEGDATSAGLEIEYGSAFAIDEQALRRSFSRATAFSAVGIQTPPILQASLIAPYTEGFSFVQDLRRQRDWKTVDEAFRKLPETTEQVLHPEKFYVREPAAKVTAPAFSSLGAGFSAAYEDSNGELGLRLMLNEWAPQDVAIKAAAGWGGDRGVIATKAIDATTVEYAHTLALRMDTQSDAAEVARVLERRWTKQCTMRPDLGPFAWRLKGKDVYVVVGPYEKKKSAEPGVVPAFRATASCAQADAWLKSVVH